MKNCVSRSILSRKHALVNIPRRIQYNDLSIGNNKNNNGNNQWNKWNKWNIMLVGTMLIGGILFKEEILNNINNNINDNNNDNIDIEGDIEHTVMNYSATHSATPLYYFEPNTVKEVENLVSYCNKNKISFRAMGSGISPNGISYSNNAIMDMSNCNRIIDIDQENMEITVEAGCKVKDILNALKPYNMTLENIASIQEQQIGGLTQVGAHGTGINIGPCDMQIIKMTIITPKYGKLELTTNDDLFYFARVGLGSIGVMTQCTVKCVKRHKLSESIYIMDVNELISKRNELILNNKHIKWLWIPYTNNKVIVIASNEVNNNINHDDDVKNNDIENEIKCQKPMRELLCSKTGENINNLNKYLSFADLRDLLLSYNDCKYILDTDWIKQINSAELGYWSNISNNKQRRIDYNENILSFECGGQQWVFEVCFPMKQYHDNNDDMPIEIQFTLDLLKEIEINDIAAPSPLEQRFTSRSTSYLSPAFSRNIGDKFCWFGIIFYLPTNDEQKRRWITNEFHIYSNILNKIADKYGAVGHWAKIETHHLTKNERGELQNRLKKKFNQNLNQFIKIINKYDPNHILINDVVSDLFDIS